jgi:maltose alpha-D-glucosyltransferase/alpha-amylase
MAQWCTFLRNHDELDLSTLTDEQRNDVFRAFAPKADMRIYGRGIRRRLAPMLGNDPRRIRLAYSLQFTMPGTPVLRYGEEIGMGENLRLHGRDAIRTPMQWQNAPRAGFSTARDKDLIRPVTTRGAYSMRDVNVETQQRDSNSLLRWSGELIRVLRECPEIGVGEPSVIDAGLPRSVLVHRFDAPEGSIVLLHNLSDTQVTVELDGIADRTYRPLEVFSDSDYGASQVDLTRLSLNGWGYRWIRLRRSNAV